MPCWVAVGSHDIPCHARGTGGGRAAAPLCFELLPKWETGRSETFQLSQTYGLNFG